MIAVAHTCPHCGTHHTCATDPCDPDATVRAGDVSVCIRCAGVIVFTSAKGSARAGHIGEFDGLMRQSLEQLIKAVKVYR